MKPQVILASGSPRRTELISRLGVEVLIDPSRIAEDAATEDPRMLVTYLSQQKALDVASRHKSFDIVIGADTCVYAGGKILGKPSSHEEASAMIRLLQGSKHQVFTGVTLAQYTHSFSRLRIRTFVEETKVHVYPMTEEEILSYAMSEEPMDKAGAYGIQGEFARYISHLEGDYFNVMGLPVGRLYREWKDFTDTSSDIS